MTAGFFYIMFYVKQWRRDKVSENGLDKPKLEQTFLSGKFLNIF